jgi:hypothetical protein
MTGNVCVADAANAGAANTAGAQTTNGVNRDIVFPRNYELFMSSLMPRMNNAAFCRRRATSTPAHVGPRALPRVIKIGGDLNSARAAQGWVDMHRNRGHASAVATRTRCVDDGSRVQHGARP